MKKHLNCALFITLLAMAGLLSGSCSSMQTEPDLIGRINTVQQTLTNDRPGLILVDSPGDKTADKYVLTVTAVTRIQRQADEKLKPASFGEMQAGQQIKVWLSGPVRESYPAQADARQIVILE